MSTLALISSFLAFTGALFGVVIWLTRPKPLPPEKLCTVIHAAAGVSCPPGYNLVKDFFNEADGSTRDAYVVVGPGHDIRVDYLLPGESFGIGFQLRVRP